MQLQFIEATLLDPQLVNNWKETLMGWEGATRQQVAGVITWIAGQRDQFLEAVREINDPETLDMVVAVRYIELKSHWILLNTQINYVCASGGEPNMVLMYRASLITGMLEMLERMIDEDDIDRILSFLTEPVGLKEAA